MATNILTALIIIAVALIVIAWRLIAGEQSFKSAWRATGRGITLPFRLARRYWVPLATVTTVAVIAFGYWLIEEERASQERWAALAKYNVAVRCSELADSISKGYVIVPKREATKIYKGRAGETLWRIAECERHGWKVRGGAS